MRRFRTVLTATQTARRSPSSGVARSASRGNFVRLFVYRKTHAFSNSLLVCILNLNTLYLKVDITSIIS